MPRTSCLILIKSLTFSGGKFICPNSSSLKSAVWSKLSAEAPSVVREKQSSPEEASSSPGRGAQVCALVIINLGSVLCCLPSRTHLIQSRSDLQINSEPAEQGSCEMRVTLLPSSFCLLCTFAFQSCRYLSTFKCGQVHENKQGTDFLQDWGPGLQTFR